MAQPSGSTKKTAFKGYGGRRPFALATETLLVFRGRIQAVKKVPGYSIIQTKTAILRVYWAGNILPPDIYIGDVVCAVGKVRTYDDGRDWKVSDALPLLPEASWGDVMKPIYERLFMFARDPAEWCPKEVINMYRFRRGKYTPTP